VQFFATVLSILSLTTTPQASRRWWRTTCLLSRNCRCRTSRWASYLCCFSEQMKNDWLLSAGACFLTPFLFFLLFLSFLPLETTSCAGCARTHFKHRNVVKRVEIACSAQSRRATKERGFLFQYTVFDVCRRYSSAHSVFFRKVLYLFKASQRKTMPILNG